MFAICLSVDFIETIKIASISMLTQRKDSSQDTQGTEMEDPHVSLLCLMDVQMYKELLLSF